MNFFNVIEKIKKKEAALILYCLLDRIPIIIIGNEPEIVNTILIELSEIVHIRSELVFNTDFISIEEYEYLVQNENIDYNIPRITIRSPCNASIKALELFDNFTSWIIGISKNDKKFNIKRLKNLLKHNFSQYVILEISKNKFEIDFEGITMKSINISLEEDILNKISKDTEKSIVGMKRILLERINTQDLDENIVKTLLDFNSEKEELKKNILKKEVQNFFSASKRAFFILSKLSLLYNMEMNIKLSFKTLLKTIDYEHTTNDGHIIAPIERLLSFIKKEWGEDYTSLIDNDKKFGLTENIQSLWG